MLSVARSLEPDPRGFGTHEQLGLPPCGFASQTGMPCPTCGMTTSFAHFARGHVVDALRSNAFGAVAFLAVVAVTLVAGSRLVAGRPDLSLWVRLPWRVLSPAILAIWLGSWGISVLRMMLTHGGLGDR
ncbi:MAG: DUF2752 domain-containing protein [Planctomycetes bacterium]|nr:DUF2752 domain-containing protein [Planctomycetota bacterium]MBI3847284.1 DUF2752 domain-containing protein [Planctomycetota bacterium]